MDKQYTAEELGNAEIPGFTFNPATGEYAEYEAPSPEETAAGCTVWCESRYVSGHCENCGQLRGLHGADALSALPPRETSPRGYTETDAQAAAWRRYEDAQMDRDVVDYDDAFGL